jgi:hypothetical protein
MQIMKNKPGMVINACNPNRIDEFKASLGYIARSCCKANKNKDWGIKRQRESRKKKTMQNNA